MKTYIKYLSEAVSRGILDESDCIFWSNFHRKNRMKGLLYSPILHTYKSFNK